MTLSVVTADCISQFRPGIFTEPLSIKAEFGVLGRMYPAVWVINATVAYNYFDVIQYSLNLTPYVLYAVFLRDNVNIIPKTCGAVDASIASVLLRTP